MACEEKYSVPSKASSSVPFTDRWASTAPACSKAWNRKEYTGLSVAGGVGSSRLRMWLSEGIPWTPNSVLALFSPCACSRVRWYSKNEGLCMKNTEKALSPASTSVYTPLGQVFGFTSGRC